MRRKIFSAHLLVVYSAWIAKIINATTQIVVIRYLIEYIGVDGYGFFTVLSSLAIWMSLTDCGFGVALQNRFSELQAGKLDQTTLFAQIRIIQIALLVFWIPVLTFASFPISSYIASKGAPTTAHMLLTLLALSMILLVNAVASISYKILYAMHRGYISNIYPAFANIISLCAIVLLIKLNYFENKIFFAWLSCNVPAVGLALAANCHLGRGVGGVISNIDLGALKKIAVNALRFFGFSLLVTMVTGLDYFVMIKILPTKDIAIYSIASRIFSFIYIFYYSILLALWPTFAELMHLQDYRKIKRTLIVSIIQGATIISVGSGLLIYFSEEVGMVLTDNKIKIEASTILYFCFYYLLRVWGDAFSVVIASVNRINILLVYMPIQALVSVSLQYYLGRLLGLNGIILGIALSFLMTAFWLNPLALMRFVREPLEKVKNKFA